MYKTMIHVYACIYIYIYIYIYITNYIYIYIHIESDLQRARLRAEEHLVDLAQDVGHLLQRVLVVID